MITTRNLLASVATAALIAGAAGAASAASITSGDITITNDQVNTISGNDFFGTQTFTAIQNDIGKSATVSLADPTGEAVPAGQSFVGYDLTFTVIFREAAFNNTFVVNNATLSGTSVTNNTFIDFTGDTTTFFLAAGAPLNFSFGVNGVAGDAGVITISNAGEGVWADAVNNTNSVTFMGTDACPASASGAPGDFCGGSTTLPANQMFLMFDDGDSVPKPDDDNHDDLIILMTATAVFQEVAEPVTLGILGLGLAGIGLMARRRRLV